ncbi:hypothetical protein EVAR_6956_1 [Eumeta japonica]|uniref:Uncharacterized protein n=1 Tax=Eumeta variegata TaxID=151549 RepID=A0A4C1TJN4_EUMVA|nr:hypothetical protein EVAR_6956_1 [Eumeta japonica]
MSADVKSWTLLATAAVIAVWAYFTKASRCVCRIYIKHYGCSGATHSDLLVSYRDFKSLGPPTPSRRGPGAADGRRRCDKVGDRRLSVSSEAYSGYYLTRLTNSSTDPPSVSAKSATLSARDESATSGRSGRWRDPGRYTTSPTRRSRPLAGRRPLAGSKWKFRGDRAAAPGVRRSGSAALRPTWLQHETGPSRAMRYDTLTEHGREIVASAVGFRPVSENSGCPLALRHFAPHFMAASPSSIFSPSEIPYLPKRLAAYRSLRGYGCRVVTVIAYLQCHACSFAPRKRYVKKVITTKSYTTANIRYTSYTTPRSVFTTNTKMNTSKPHRP